MASELRTPPQPVPEPSSAAGPEARRPFVLAPFRGLRFNPERVGDLGTVISPPYDVLDADTVRDLEAANRRNIVRLILSRRFEKPYLAVRNRLDAWRDKSYLRPDDTPALYLYEYTVDQVTVRGLVGVVALRDEAERVIVPHEDVMPEQVDDRKVLMRTTGSNLEPILLVHEGTDRLRMLLEHTSRTAPLAAFTALDGSDHQMWAITDPDCLQMVSAELADTRALIADGHHRYAAYLDLQREMRSSAADSDASPWDYGLALLVDQRHYPLAVGPIHRSIAALTIADVQEISVERGDDFTTYPDREAAFAARFQRAEDDSRASFVLSDGRVWAVLRTPRTEEVDAAVLHSTLLEAWHVAEEQIGYHHSLDQALQITARQPGIVVAVSPPTVRQVIDSALRGVRMPRKSTSFSPKPRMGVVMRDLRDS
jgi:uncharacterized protein (DUF1015 family)